MYIELFFLTLWWTAKAGFYEDHYAEIKKSFQAEAKGQKLSWMLGINDRFRGMSLADMKAFLGVSKETLEDSNFTIETIDDLSAVSLPEEFDARTQWPECAELISVIKDQSNCGSCWAVSAASVMSDRTCIASNGKITKFFSDQELLTCCKNCGDGCNGGNPLPAMRYWKNTGVPTGGLYGSKEGCKPYSIPPNNENKAETPACTKKCIEEYPVDLAKDRSKGKRGYRIAATERAMMKQLYQNGPIVAIFTVYTDLYYYKSGIYEHKKGINAGYHAVRIIGWGKEEDEKYWLAANSWGTGWGENGYFKIKRGKNECKIEAYSVAGDPKI